MNAGVDLHENLARKGIWQKPVLESISVVNIIAVNACLVERIAESMHQYARAWATLTHQKDGAGHAERWLGAGGSDNEEQDAQHARCNYVCHGYDVTCMFAERRSCEKEICL